MSSFETLLGQRILICDGAMGTMLHAAGSSLDRALSELNLSNPGLVRTIHESYIGAGADIILTNTFGASSLRLAAQGFGDKVKEINLAGTSIAAQSREAAERPVLIGGSVAPAVTSSQRRRISAAERVDALHEQITALTNGGVDLIVLETFGYLEELAEAVTVAASVSSVPIVAQATFASDGRTLGGESPDEVATALAGLPVAVIGTNCTLGPQGALSIVEGLAARTNLPVSAQPNAGLPRRLADGRFEYNVDCAYFARYARRLVEAGAVIIGGCCGTTPAHIQAAAAEVADMTPARVRDRRGDVVAGGYQLHERAATNKTNDDLREQLSNGTFVTAALIATPLGGATDEAADQAAALRERGIGTFFIASKQSPRAQLSSIDLAYQLQHRIDIETIPTMTTWDKTIMSLQADLLGANALGIATIVCETGNPPIFGDYPNVDGIWDVDSIGLLKLVADLNTGLDCYGLPLASGTSFYAGAVVNPSATDLDAEIARTAAKVQAGARFLVSRPAYELDALKSMLDALAQHQVPLLLSIAPLRSFAEADLLAHEVPDITIPYNMLVAMERAGAHAERTGIEMAAALLAEAKPLVQGAVLALPRADTAALDVLLSALG